MPLFYAGAVCPKETYPPADPLQFCSTAFGAQYDSQMAMGFVKSNSKEAPRVGYSAMAIPISRGEIDYAEGLAKQMGMTPVDKQVIPPPTPDYTPFATKLKDANPNWVYSWAPWVTQVRTLEALRRLGWKGSYIAYAHIQSEDELERLKDGDLYVFGTNAFFQDDLPVHAEIRAATAPREAQLSDDAAHRGLHRRPGARGGAQGARPGRRRPRRCSPSMNNLKVDTKGLRGGPLEWTKDNHFRTKQYYRVYRWDPSKNADRPGEGLDRDRREVARANAGSAFMDAAARHLGRATAGNPAAEPRCSSPSTSSSSPSIYALIGCGYVLIYRVSRVLNLAHGELMMLAAYLLLTTASLFSGHPLVALVASARPRARGRRRWSTSS